MGRSQESFNKKNVRTKKEKKRKEKEKKRLARKDKEKKSSLDDMIAYVDDYGRITDSPPSEDEKEEINAEDIELGVPSRADNEEDIIRKGVVIFFNNAKEYGFIKDLETKENYFVHLNNTVDDIKEGLLVTFEIGNSNRGPMATNVKKHVPEKAGEQPSEQ